MKAAFHYEVICENLFMKETGNYCSYGIRGAAEGCGQEVQISDISLDKAEVQALVETLNNMQLDTSQLQEVVEDFLA